MRAQRFWFAASCASFLVALAGATPQVARADDETPAQAALKPVSEKPAAHKSSDNASAEKISAAQVAKWIAELDSEFYLIRERASEQLAKAGPAALEPLAAAADGTNLEVATRAVRAMFQISEANAGQHARVALERIAALQNRPVEKGAAEAVLRGLAEREAIAEVKRLGGIAEREYEVDGEIVIYMLRIGEDWKGGNDGLKAVQHLKGLRYLQLHGAPITDEGLALVSQMPELAKLEVYGTDASLEAVNQVRKALPNCDVQYRLGALLGIRGTPNGAGGAFVEGVQEETAAADAGIQIGDTIVKYDDKEIDNFEQLTDCIGKCRPGDKAVLEIIRPVGPGKTETISKEVTFGKWR